MPPILPRIKPNLTEHIHVRKRTREYADMKSAVDIQGKESLLGWYFGVSTCQ